MKTEKIKKILFKLTSDLSEPGKKTGDDFEKETIHKFRVAVKSLKSFLKLLNNQADYTALKLPGKLKRLYHIAGAIRDIQLESEKAEKTGIAIPGYTDHLALVLAQQKKAWKNHYSGKIFSKLETKLSCFDPGEVPANALNNFLVVKLAVLASLIKHEILTDNQLHTIRKEMKDMTYSFKISKKNWKSATRQSTNPDTDELKRITAAIGDYNDDRNMMEHIKSFTKNLVHPGDKKKIKTLTTGMVKQLRVRKNEITTEVRKYMAAIPEI